MLDFIGRELGDYRIVERISAGGMGEVFLAENIHHGKAYALKILPAKLARDANFRKRFFDEARVMSELDHPNIVRVDHMGEDQGVYYLVMDYITSPSGQPRSLHEELAQSPKHRISPRKAHRWILQVAHGLAYAHRHGVIHRDIKPANILISFDGGVKITDFGLVKLVGTEFFLSQIHETGQAPRPQRLEATATVADDSLESNATPLDVSRTVPDTEQDSHSDEPCGTYDYMSPELLDGKEATKQSDLYSLGVTIYRVLTGRRPVGMARPPSRIVPGLSRRWDVIARRCLADTLEDRYQSAEELVADLRKITEPRRAWMMALAGFLTVIAAVGAASLLGLGTREIKEGWAKAVAVVMGRSSGPASRPMEQLSPNTVPSEPNTSAALDRVPEPRNPTVKDQQALVEELRQILTDHPEFTHLLRKVDEQLQKAETLLVEGKPADAVTTYGEIIREIVNTAGGKAGESLLALADFSGAEEFASEIEPIGAEKEQADMLQSRAEYVRATQTYLTVTQRAEPVLEVLRKRRDVLAGRRATQKIQAGAEQMEVGICICLSKGTGCSCFRKTYELAMVLWEQGQSRFEQRQFDQAQESWQKAKTHFEEAIALAQSEVQRHRDLWAAALLNPLPERLAQFADEAKRMASSAQAAQEQGKFATAIMGYRRAAQLQGLREELAVPIGEDMELLMEFVPAGEFQMGSALEDRDRREEEYTRRTLLMSRGFYMGQYEVTQAQYEAVMGDNPSAFPGPVLPVDSVTWDEARLFCTKLTARLRTLGFGRLRLPTEPEWEYACRAGTTSSYCAGDGERALRKVGWYRPVGSGGPERTKPVGQFDANRWGLHDMHGNVYEWCEDAYRVHPDSKEADPNVPDSAQPRALRGGSWNVDLSFCRSASRCGVPPQTRRNDIGFRVVMDIE